jgi:acetyl esterase/lipase
MGDSAGGGLALSLTVAARAEGMRPPRHLVLLSPWLDVGMTAREAVPFDAADVFLTRDGLIRAGRQYAGAAGTADWRASPLFADLAGLPATTVLAGTADQLVLDARRLGSRAVAAGSPVVVHEVPGMVHDWVLFGLVPEARAALDLVVECVLG